jgi:T5orf172 domain
MIFPSCKSCQKPLASSYTDLGLRYCLECHTKYKAERKDRQAQKRKKKAENSVVYFIQGISGGAIKIGHTTDLPKRLATLQTGYPEPLCVLKTIRGGKPTEQALHTKFAAANKQGEWFNPVDELLKYISGL